MAVTECKFSRLSNAAGSFDERNLGSYTVAWSIKADSLMGPRAVANASQSVGPDPLPDLWDEYSFLGDSDSTSYLRGLTIKPRGKGSSYLWRAVGSYLPLAPGQVFGDYSQADPLLRGPVWDGDGEVYTKLIEEDKNGDALVNYAGVPFNPTLEREESWPVALATKNYTDLDAVFAVMTAMNNAVNSVTWRGRAPRTVKCGEVRPHAHQTEGDHTYYPVSFPFVLAEDGKNWDDRIMEQGFSYFTAPNDPTTRVDVEGAEPVLLNTDGTKLPGAQPALFRAWRTRREVDFAAVLGF